MTNELKETIQNFLVDYDNTVDDFMSRADYDFWMDTAINLLQQCIVDDYKIIPQDKEDQMRIARKVMIQDKDALSRLANGE